MASLGDNITAVAVRGHVRRLSAARQAGVRRRRAARARLADAGQLDQPRAAAAAGLLLLPAGRASRGEGPDRLGAERQLRQPDGRPDRQAPRPAGAAVRGGHQRQRRRAGVPADGRVRAARVGANGGQRHGRRRAEQLRAHAGAVRRRPRRAAARRRRAVRSTTRGSWRRSATCTGVTATCSIRTAPSRWLALQEALDRRARRARACFWRRRIPAKFREVVEPAIGRAGAAAAVRSPRRWRGRAIRVSMCRADYRGACASFASPAETESCHTRYVPPEPGDLPARDDIPARYTGT